MNEQNNMEKTWWERNKKKVLIIGGVAVCVGVLVFNKDALIKLVKADKRLAKNVPQIADPTVVETTPKMIPVVDPEAINVRKPLNNGLPFGVKEFIRNLPDGWHPSAEKIAQAAALGITLEENQTLVNDYVKNVA